MSLLIGLALALLVGVITWWIGGPRRKPRRAETSQSPELTAAVRRHPSSGGSGRPLRTFIPRPRHGGGPHHPKRQR
ncbi:hypothetical protein ACIP98_21295 [Streptomyces sp. NPDC088354]|uniref:hypothetical protein n=1 Tax=Streptomyces sp. NPDC088354 TaxID=3365856 RepID=UPI00382D5722